MNGIPEQQGTKVNGIIKEGSTDERNGATETFDLSALEDYEDESLWINEILGGQDDEVPSLALLDTKLARLLGHLELASADTASAVDRTIGEISRSVPRLSFDLQLMREHALLLRFTLDSINRKSLPTQEPNPMGVALDPETVKVMERLTLLDTAKNRMEAARDVLREAESWSTLDSEVTSLITEREYVKAAERLAEAARSMVLFNNTVEYEGRRALMISLQNTLESSLSSSLVAAINSRDVKACKTYYNIFNQIERETEFRNYYYGSRKSLLSSYWNLAVLTDCRSSNLSNASSAVPFSTFLPRFFTELTALLNEERTYITSIFPDPSVTLALFLQTTIDNLNPSFSNRLGEVIEFYGPHGLLELIKLYHATEEFGLAVDGILNKTSEKDTVQTPPTSASDAPTSKKEHRASKRLSMSIARRLSARTPSFTGSFNFGSNSDVEGPRAWELVLFEPFLDFQVEYSTLENRLLESILFTSLTPPKELFNVTAASEEADRGARALRDQASTLFTNSEEALGRLVGLTHGYAAPGFVETVDRTMASFLSARRHVLLQMGKKSTAPSTLPGQNPVDLEGLDYSTEDWARFQLALRLLETSRSITERLASFESKSRSRLAILAQTISEAAKNPFGHIVPGTPRGALILLRQSTLNSVDLARLVDTVVPPSITPLFTRSRTATVDFTKACQLLLHDTILSPLLHALAPYASLPIWSTSSTDPKPESKGSFDLDIPTFSLSPTEIISRVGEGLFNLPRLFEVYADDDALAFSIETLPFVDINSVFPLNTPIENVPIEALLSPTMKRFETLNLAETPAPNPPVMTAEAVVSTWLSSLTLSIVTHLTSTILPQIKRLTSQGSVQLATDLAYLLRVARVLEADSEELEKWHDYAELEDQKGRNRIQSMFKGEIERDEILEQIGKCRGWLSSR